MTYTNFKHCTDKGKRVSVFARPINVLGKNERTEIFLLECSKSDNFSRRRAREAYENWLNGRGCSYLTKIKGRCESNADTPPNHICVGKQIYKINVCNPSIVNLPITCSHKNVDKYLKSFLKVFVPKSRINEIIREIIKIQERLGNYVEK